MKLFIDLHFVPNVIIELKNALFITIVAIRKQTPYDYFLLETMLILYSLSMDNGNNETIIYGDTVRFHKVSQF